MGNNISLVGGNGAGQTCNIANQIIVALNGARSLGLAFPQTVSAAQFDKRGPNRSRDCIGLK